MKSIFFLATALFCCITANAQICDLTYIFHLGQEPRSASLIYCYGESKNTYWMGNPKEIFIFDSDGNLKSHNDIEYTDFVRDDDGILKEVTCGKKKFKLSFDDTKIVIDTYSSSDDSFYCKDEYFLNNEGYVIKKITTFWDGDKNIKTYNYVEKSGGNWYIRKVKEQNSYGTEKYYECLKGSGI